MKLEFHIHTPYSDGLNPISYLRWYGRDKLLIITDHDTIKGSVAYSKYRKTVLAEEILCVRDNRKVEIIGMFLTENIKPGMDFLETIDKIHEQGAIAIAPHPLDQARYGLGEDAHKYVDVVEVFNAKIDDPKLNDLAKTLFKDALTIVGSDAHYPLALGSTMIEIDEFDLENPKDFLKKLKNAKFSYRYYSWPTRMIWKGVRIVKRIIKKIKRI